MKKLLLSLLTLAAVQASAQTTFQWDTNDTIEVNLNANTYDQYPMYQSVTGNDTVTLQIEIIHNDLPQSWDGMVCVYGLCMGTIPAVGTQATMDPIYGSNQGMIRLTVNPFNGTETAKLQVKVWDVEHPNDADTATFLLNTTLNTPELLAAQITLAPNPVEEVLTIDSEFKLSEVQIIDASGRMLRTHDINLPAASIDVADLPKGIYVIRLKGDIGITEKRFVKQ
jgi:hypothetical protein